MPTTTHAPTPITASHSNLACSDLPAKNPSFMISPLFFYVQKTGIHLRSVALESPFIDADCSGARFRCGFAAARIRSAPCLPLLLVHASADDDIGLRLAVHRLGLDFFGHRIGKFVVLPEAALALRQLHALLDEFLAVDIL